MRRKIIKQGLGGYTIYLPKEWIILKNLNPGDEIEIQADQGNLVLSSRSKNQKAEATISLLDCNFNLVKRTIINQYRFGIDKIRINYNDEKVLGLIKQVVSSQMIGFEIISYNNNSCILESITDTNAENFWNIVNNEFFILKNMIREVESNLTKKDKLVYDNVASSTQQIQKYADFLRRCISKKLFSNKISPFYWLFISYINLTARKIGFLNNHLKNNNVKNNDEITKMFDHARKILDVVHKIYQSKNIDLLKEVHEIEHNGAVIDGIRFLESKKQNGKGAIHYLINIIRMIYHVSSPLQIIIQDGF